MSIKREEREVIRYDCKLKIQQANDKLKNGNLRQPIAFANTGRAE